VKNGQRATGNGQRAMVLIACGLVSSVALAAPRQRQKAVSAHTTETRGYLEELEKRGLIDKTGATPEKLQRELERADQELVAGHPLDAARRLYAVVEGPRFADLADSDDYQDAEYRLGVALAKGGASRTARDYFERSIRRGKAAPLYEAALRGYVDLCVEEKIAAECSGTLDKLKAEDVGEELTYLRGRAAF